MLGHARMKRPHLHLPHWDTTSIELAIGAALIAAVLKWFV